MLLGDAVCECGKTLAEHVDERVDAACVEWFLAHVGLNDEDE